MHLLALLLLAAPTPAAPPAEVYPTSAGTAGVSFLLPGGGDPRVGLTYFIAQDTAVRLDFGLDAPLSPSGAGQNILFSVGGALRLYRLKHNHVALYLQPSVELGRELSPAVSADAALFLRLGGGAGVEYFFTPNFSAGANLELSLKIANLAGPGGTGVYTTLSTSTSSLQANIYF